LVAAANSLEYKTKRVAADQLGGGWKVLVLGDKIGKHGNTVTLDPENEFSKN